MVDIFEYAEAHWPTRVLQQEEEEQAIETVCLDAPSVQWEEAYKGSLANGTANVQLLVVAVTPAASALLNHCFPAQRHVGSVVPPPAPASSRGDFADDSPAAAHTHMEGPSSIYQPEGSPGVLLVHCSEKVDAPRAGAWVRGVFGCITAQQALILGSLQAQQYCGEGDPSQEARAFLLHTSASRLNTAQQQQQQIPPLLPTGNIVSGLPAAALTHCQLHGVPADLITTVDMVELLVPFTLPALAAGAAGVAGATSHGGVAAALADSARVSAACKALEQGLRLSSLFT